ncbi:MAG TPA: MerC domain-containing protein [Novosphingobium sp.]|nr:MerC domain-containing protein [Novosphingobium sp.]
MSRTPPATPPALRRRFDRLGIVLSGLCAVHCLLGIALVSILGLGGLGGELLLAPEIHRIGLGLAIAVGLVALGYGARRHGRIGPLAIGACGLALMGAALAAGHGVSEAVLTIAGVALVALAHIRNLRHAH